jgi:hypothetical protein
MLYGIIILATALLLSLTAEYYSIMGLTAIFAAAVIPVIVMGASLGLGKVVATVWLHNNWKRVPWTFKTYLVPAIAFLMFLTSMGIFGYLSKAHLEQATQTGDSQAQVALYDEKIKTQKDNIESARLALKQMDATVDQTIARSTDAGSVQIASALRKRQQKERAGLQDEIGTAQANIAKLQEQRAPLAAQSRKIEAEVGPIKYIAALLYGDNPDANLLERAVRWVIILIVMVFDPLALCLILAANLQFEWARHGRGGFVHDEEDNGTPSTVPRSEAIALPDVPVERIPPMPYIVPLAPAVTSWTTTTTETVSDPVTGEEEDNTVEEVFEMPSEWDQKLSRAFTVQEKVDDLSAKIDEGIANFNEPPKPDEFTPEMIEIAEKIIAERVSEDMYDDPLPNIDTMPAALQSELDFADSEHFDIPDSEEFPELAQEDIPTAGAPLSAIPAIPDMLNITDASSPELVEVVTEHVDPNTRIRSFKSSWVAAPLVADNDPTANKVASDFGTSFPEIAAKGDMYLRVDFLPTKLFKFNGVKWMEVDKTTTDSYTFNDEYVKYLIAKIDSGEYSMDDLTEAEQDQIAEYLSKN